MSRPYFRTTIERLEQMYRESASDPEVLAALGNELRHRNTKRAAELLKKIKSGSGLPHGKSPTKESPSAMPGRPATTGTSGPTSAVTLPVTVRGPLVWDERQLRVVEAEPGARLLVSAGPGMGKTEVACGRVVHLLEAGLEPSHIWLVSFTRTAVHEIRERIRRLGKDHPGANALRVATIDSHGWQLLQGFDPEAAEVFGGYEETIDALASLLRRRDEALCEFLAGVEHVFVDEAQDVVGSRADLLIELIRCLPSNCGITIFTDDAQAIYGFTDDQAPADNIAPENLPTRLRARELAGFSESELVTIHRTTKKNLIALFHDGRQDAIHAHANPSEALTRIRASVKLHADGEVGAIHEQNLEGKHDTLVLFRTRVEVLEASSYLGATDHRIRMSGTPSCIHPWLGLMLWDCDADRLSETDFMQRWQSRVYPMFPELDAERAWRSIRMLAGHQAIVRLKDLKARLNRSAPLDLMLPELGFRGPILGTIHASKGREASEVHLMLPVAVEAGAAGEARVTFVAATRARTSLRIGQGKKLAVRTVPSGRVYLRTAKPDKARVEIGRPEDVDVSLQASRGTWRQKTAHESQDFLRRHASQTLTARLVCDPDDEWRYSILCEANGAESVTQRVGHVNLGLNKELFYIAGQLWPGQKRRPPGEIRFVRFLGARTIVPTPGQCEILIEPFNRTGVLLAPIVSALATVPFFQRRGPR